MKKKYIPAVIGFFVPLPLALIAYISHIFLERHCDFIPNWYCLFGIGELPYGTLYLLVYPFKQLFGSESTSFFDILIMMIVSGAIGLMIGIFAQKRLQGYPSKEITKIILYIIIFIIIVVLPLVYYFGFFKTGLGI